MKQIIFIAVWAGLGAFVTHQALAETVIVDDKAYQLVEIDGELLVSNEWQPTTEQGYTDEYLQSEQYKTVKAANESLKRIKEGEL
ncbi:hypothetical protein [Psychrobacter sp. UBA2514]|jgi:hypothetical protein|uniref:hypothetical protein n=1 Tax=Psychrobacter sp. UBA2514 TaxID=1947346 RepID=UPI00257DC8E0|nr:hypothetical protein [Psychrobacter sp. UBA2514]|tara:strand:+ start:14578 stop:14832 length:255 start_codon:yes stop_codon:yes gene_type:complete